MQSITIDFLIRSLGQGGAERQLVLLASGMARRGHRVRIVTFYRGGHFEREAVARGLEVTSLDKGGRWDVLHSARALRRETRERAPDALLSYMGGANILAALVAPFGRCATIWGIRSANVDLSKYGWLSVVSHRVEVGLATMADLIIVNSEAGREHARRAGFPAGRMAVVENGFECEKWRFDSAAGARFRASIGVAPATPLVGIVGRLDPIKGHEAFLRAARRLAARRADAHFVVVGADPGSRRSELEALARSLGVSAQCHWVRSSSDLVPAYSALQLIVSASTSEGFPNVVAEAMACGVRPVVTDVGDSARVVGRCGWVVPSGDAAALGDALLVALDPAAASLPDPAAHIETSFGVERLVDRTEELVRGVVDRRRASWSRR